MSDCSNEHPAPLLFRLTVRHATVVEPSRGIAPGRTVDHAAVVQIEEKGMAVGRARAFVATLRLPPGDKFAFVLDDRRASRNFCQREDAAAMNMENCEQRYDA